MENYMGPLRIIDFFEKSNIFFRDSKDSRNVLFFRHSRRLDRERKTKNSTAVLLLYGSTTSGVLLFTFGIV